MKKLGKLSGGERRLMELMVLLYAPGKFLLLDEPFSYLSPVLVEQVTSHILSQANAKGIVITDHQYRTVLSLCTKYYVLREGSIREFETLSQLEDFGYIPDDDRTP